MLKCFCVAGLYCTSVQILIHMYPPHFTQKIAIWGTRIRYSGKTKTYPGIIKKYPESTKKQAVLTDITRPSRHLQSENGNSVFRKCIFRANKSKFHAQESKFRAQKLF